MRNIERADLTLSRAVAVAESLRQRHAEAVRAVGRLHEEYRAALDRWVPQEDCPQCEIVFELLGVLLGAAPGDRD